MSSKNQAYFLGIENSNEYNVALKKLTEEVDLANKRYTENPWVGYVKTVRYKKTGKIALFHSERRVGSKLASSAPVL